MSLTLGRMQLVMAAHIVAGPPPAPAPQGIDQPAATHQRHQQTQPKHEKHSHHRAAGKNIPRHR